MKIHASILTLITSASTATMAAPAAPKAPTTVQLPAGCKSLALMQAQLLHAHFHDAQMTGKAYNPQRLALKTANGLKIGSVTLLGGDSDEAGNLPCETQPKLCTNPADAGGAIDWAQVEVTDKANNVVADVIVSMGSRGGCTISSAKVPANN